jgi:hypothetical protein
VRLLALVCLVVIGYLAYSVGYTRGLKASPEYSRLLIEKERFANSKEVEELRSRAYAAPTQEECVPVMSGVEVDEYTFCEDLLGERMMRDQEASQDSDREPER